jgi:hypothetical protein
MSFTVQPGQTIRQITRNTGCSFNKLKNLNPDAVGRTNDGRYFFKAGAVLQVSAPESVQTAKIEKTSHVNTTVSTTTTTAAQTNETVAEASRRLGVSYADLIQANVNNVFQGDDGRYYFQPNAQVEMPRDFNTVLAEKTSEPKAEQKAAPPVQPRPETPVLAETSDEKSNEPSLLDKILNSVSVDTPLQETASQSNIKSPDQPLASTRNDMVKIKCGLAPNLGLTLGLTREKTVTDEGLESYSSPWSDRSYSIGLTFRF